jgi:hypothetical protein
VAKLSFPLVYAKPADACMQLVMARLYYWILVIQMRTSVQDACGGVAKYGLQKGLRLRSVFGPGNMSTS